MKTKISILLLISIFFIACNPENNNSNVESNDSSKVVENNIEVDNSIYYTYNGEVTFDKFLSFFTDTILPLGTEVATKVYNNKLIPTEFNKFIDEEDYYLCPTVKFKIHNFIAIVVSQNYNEELGLGNFYLYLFDKQGNIVSKKDLGYLYGMPETFDFYIDENYNFSWSYHFSPLMNAEWYYQDNGTAYSLSGRGDENEEKNYKIMSDGSFASLEPGLDEVNNFLEKLSWGDFDGAFEMQQNPTWGDLDKFSSIKAFGGIADIEIIETKFISENNNLAEIYCEAIYKDTINGDMRIKQNFYLNKINKEWIITKMKVLEFQKIATYQCNNFKYSKLELENITDKGFDFDLIVVAPESNDDGNFAGEIYGTASYDDEHNSSATYKTDDGALNFTFHHKNGIEIIENNCAKYRHSNIKFNGYFEKTW